MLMNRLHIESTINYITGIGARYVMVDPWALVPATSCVTGWMTEGAILLNDSTYV